MKDIFAVQSEIAGAVAKQLKVALLGNNGQAAQLTTAAAPSNQNVEPYNAFLQGNFYFNRRIAQEHVATAAHAGPGVEDPDRTEWLVRAARRNGRRRRR